MLVEGAYGFRPTRGAGDRSWASRSAVPRYPVVRLQRRPTRSAGTGGDPLFDDLICPGQQRGRDRQAEGLGGLEVDHQLELYRSPDGKLVRRRTLENSIDIGRRAAKIVEEVVPVRQQPACVDEVKERVDGRETVASIMTDSFLVTSRRDRGPDWAAIASNVREVAARLKGLR